MDTGMMRRLTPVRLRDESRRTRIETQYIRKQNPWTEGLRDESRRTRIETQYIRKQNPWTEESLRDESRRTRIETPVLWLVDF